MGDGIDQDCDGIDALRRRLLERDFASGPWTWTGTVATAGDGVRVGNASLAQAGAVTRGYTLPVHQGKLHAVLGVVANQQTVSGMECRLRVTTEAVPGPAPWLTAEWVITGQGTGSLVTGDLGVTAAPRQLREVEVDCEAGASVTLDWLSLQSTDDVVPPASEVEVSWTDTGMPGGGLASTVVRTGDGYSLWAGSDVGGVARKDPSWPTSQWRAMSGNPVQGALVSQPDLATWDILPTSWDEVFILTGRRGGTGTRGGLLSSVDEGASWQLLVDSDPEPDNNDPYETTVGGYGRFTGCGAANEWAGGALLVEEPGAESVYVANHDAEDIGLAYWDGTEACSLATTDLPGEVIGAMARVESYPNGLPALLVGYRGIGGSDDAVYLCELPLDTTDADGGNDAALGSTCESGTGGVYWLEVTDDGAGNRDWTWLGDLSTGLADLDSAVEPTGLSMDPDGDFLFAFLPVTHGSGYAADRIYRVSYADIGTGDWVAVNDDTEADELARDAALDLSDGWLAEEDDTGIAATWPRVSQRGTQATYAPGHAIDAVWFDDSVIPEADGCGGYNWSAAMTTTVNMWRADGLDGDCDGGGWDPEDDTTWTFWPEPEEFYGLAWQTTSVHDVAFDAQGNTWSAVGDIGLFLLPFDEDNAETDCLWDAFNGGGADVAATPDGAVWFTAYDQDYGGTSVPHEVGVFRTLDAGVTWAYEGAAIPAGKEYAYNEDGGLVEDYWDRLSCVDQDDTHVATPFGEVADDDDGNAFLDPSAPFETSGEYPSWGLPMALAALDQDTALVGFQGYSASDPDGDPDTADGFTWTGRLAYTVDGGVAWDAAEFDGDWAPNDPENDDCDETAFFEHVNAVAILGAGGRTYNWGGDDWRLEVFVSTDYASNTSEDYHHCALARVVVEPDPDGVPESTWTWYTLDRDDDNTVCRVDGRNLGGVATAPWGEDAFVWGGYGYVQSNGDRFGGVCAVDIDDPGLRGTVISPHAWQLSIGAVAPHPWVADLVAVAPLLDGETWAQCHHDGDGDCPDDPRLLLVENGVGGWSTSQVFTMPPSLAGSALDWTDLGTSAVVYGTSGSGTWMGTLGWD